MNAPNRNAIKIFTQIKDKKFELVFFFNFSFFSLSFDDSTNNNGQTAPDQSETKHLLILSRLSTESDSLIDILILMNSTNDLLLYLIHLCIDCQWCECTRKHFEGFYRFFLFLFTLSFRLQLFFHFFNVQSWQQWRQNSMNVMVFATKCSSIRDLCQGFINAF